jgi:uncharacterized protein YrrD
MVSATCGTVRAAFLRGRPVLSARTGEGLGSVSQVLLDLSRRAIAGFRLRHGGLLDRRWRVAALDDVVAVTATAVLLCDRVALREDMRAPELIAAHRWAPLVRTADGRLLGRVRDVRCDARTGDIDALHVRPLAGRSTLQALWLPAQVVAFWGAEVLILSLDADAARCMAAPLLEHEA